jgi:hypothetical protein
MLSAKLMTSFNLMRMWGFSVEFWSSVIVWAIVISAVAGAISIAAGFVAGIVFIHPNAAPRTKEAADVLVSVLRQLDFAPVLKETNPSTPSDNIIRLNIGTKY